MPIPNPAFVYMQPSLNNALQTAEAFEAFYRRYFKNIVPIRHNYQQISETTYQKYKRESTFLEQTQKINKTSKRGTIIDMSDNSILNFQFNPTEIQEEKSLKYEEREITGFDNTNLIWINGGNKQISFDLDFDATQASNTQYLGASNFTHDPERGTLNQVEFLQKFLHPRTKETVKFTRSNFIPTGNQFEYPSELVFIYGNYYVIGTMMSCPVTHTLFDKDLVPLRSKVSVKIHVKESYNIISEISSFNSFNDSVSVVTANNSEYFNQYYEI